LRSRILLIPIVFWGETQRGQGERRESGGLCDKSFVFNAVSGTVFHIDDEESSMKAADDATI
jgi:hypothetical protein